jgi:hypothetical protein
MHRIDGSNPGPGNSFVEGDVQAGVPRTQITGPWLTAVQEEMAGVVEAAGIALDKPDNGQVLEALNAMYLPARRDRNYLINSDFGIWQRPFAAAVVVGVGAAAFFADRWKCSPGTGGAASITATKSYLQATDMDTTGARWVVGLNQTVAGTNPYVEQKIENARSLAGKVVVLSLWADVSALGSGTTLTVGTEVVQNFGPGGGASAPVTTAGPNLVLALAGGFARYSVSFTVPSVVGKTFDLSTYGYASSFLNLRLKFPSALTYTLQITGVQLEAGSVPTPTLYREERDELELCQRYFQTSCPHYWLSGTQPPGTSGARRAWISGTDGLALDQEFRVPMRPTAATGHVPVIRWFSPVTGTGDFVRWEGADRAVTGTNEMSIFSSGYPVVAAARALSALEAHFTADAEL